MKIKPGWHSLLFIILFGCLDPYPTDDIGGDLDALVVEGFINTTDHSASVKLSRTLPLDTTAVNVVVDNAQVSIEREDGSSFAVPGSGNGQYKASFAGLDGSSRYRLNITLQSGEKYQSDYVSMLDTPDIDSVTYGEGRDGINIYVSTHDPNANTRYYKWEYVETWEYVASFYSNYILANGQVYDRTAEDKIYNCWTSSPSTRIIVENTQRLSEDVVSNFLLTSQQAGSVQLQKKYSINVMQRSLSKDEYDFWASLQKTTESVGGLFDAMPYAVTGNIHAVGNGGLALGYFGGGTVKERRIFISVYELPHDVLAKTSRVPCTEENDLWSTDLAGLSQLSPASNVLVDAIYVPFIGIVGYTYAAPGCADCRTFGGTNVMPDFWVE